MNQAPSLAHIVATYGPTWWHKPIAERSRDELLFTAESLRAQIMSEGMEPWGEHVESRDPARAQLVQVEALLVAMELECLA